MIALTLDTPISEALKKFKEQDEEPVLCDNALKQLEIMSIIPYLGKHGDTPLREFKYVAYPFKPYEEFWSPGDQPTWQLPIHKKFFRIFNDPIMDTLLKVNTLNYLIKLNAFLQIYCRGWTTDTGGECNYLVGAYVQLACKDIKKRAQDYEVEFEVCPLIGHIRNETTRPRSFITLINDDIEANEKDRQAVLCGFKDRKEKSKHWINKWRERYLQGKDD